MASKYQDLMHGTVSSFDDLFKEEHLIESLDFHYIISGISAVPVNEQLGLDHRMLLESEIKKLDDDAKNFSKRFQGTTPFIGKNTQLRVKLDPIEPTDENEGNSLSEVVANANNENIEGDDEKFLDYVYAPKGNFLLIPSIRQNIDFSCFPTTDELSSEIKGRTTFDDFERFFMDITCGKYDQLTRNRSVPIVSSSSSSESDEVSLRAKHLSSRLKFPPGDDNKFTFLKKINDDSLRLQSTMKKETPHHLQASWNITDDSENETIERRTQQEKRRTKRSQKNAGETKPKSEQNTQIPNSNTNQLLRSKPNKPVAESSNIQEYNTYNPETSSATSDVSVSHLNKVLDHSTNLKHTHGKRHHHKSRRSLHNKAMSFAQSSLTKSQELSKLPQGGTNASKSSATEESSSGIMKELVPTQQSSTGTSSSKITGTKSQKQTGKGTKSMSTKKVQQDYEDSSGSSGEDWVNLAKKNLSGFGEVLKKSSKP